MPIQDREFTDITKVDDLEHHLLGSLIAFITKEDAHSPRAIPNYESVVEQLDGVIPIYLVDARTVDPETLDEYAVYSVPTLLYRVNGVTKVRLVGTVNDKKILADLNPVIDAILGA